jgi:hypothetical protein
MKTKPGPCSRMSSISLDCDLAMYPKILKTVAPQIMLVKASTVAIAKTSLNSNFKN